MTPPRPNPPPRAIAFVGSRLLLRITDEGLRLPALHEIALGLGADTVEHARIEVTVHDGSGDEIFTLAFAEDTRIPEGFRADGLRVAWHALDEPDFRAAGTARQKLEWFRTHRFCSRCGTRTERDPAQEAMVCPACAQVHFPRVAPAVIVLVQRGKEVLLGRSPHFAPGVYSTLAGFVEPGESLEECIHREIHEEVGVRVGRLRYFGSQPHPFPHSLMVGFVADWLTGDIRIDPVEIEDARWFTSETLPELPHPMSIARALIDDFVARTGG